MAAGKMYKAVPKVTKAVATVARAAAVVAKKIKKGGRRRKVQRMLKYYGLVYPERFMTHVRASTQGSWTFVAGPQNGTAINLGWPYSVFGTENCSGMPLLMASSTTSSNPSAPYSVGIVSSVYLTIRMETTAAATAAAGAIVCTWPNPIGQSGGGTMNARNGSEQPGASNVVLLPKYANTDTITKPLIRKMYSLPRLAGLDKKTYYSGAITQFNFTPGAAPTTPITANIAVSTNNALADATLAVDYFIEAVYTIILFGRNYASV